jgi:hypothetical protein
MQESFDLDSHIELAPDARFRGVAGEGVVLNQSTAEVLVINPVGLRVLELMARDGSIAAIIAKLQEEYKVAEAELRRDVLAFLGEMAAAGAVRRSKMGSET